MKTRDELAEAFAMALAAHQPGALDDAGGEDPPEGFLSAAAWLTHHAFRLADAFVAERELRAAVVPVDKATLQLDYDQANVIALALGYDASALPLGQAIEKIKELVSRAPAEKPHSPDDGCAKCEHRGEPYGYMGQQTCGKKFGLAISMNNLTRGAPAECPKRVSATPAAEALKFDSMGDLQHPEGDAALTTPDGYSAAARHDIAIVRIRTTDRAHAERIVAAMLPVGRGTK